MLSCLARRATGSGVGELGQRLVRGRSEGERPAGGARSEEGGTMTPNLVMGRLERLDWQAVAEARKTGPLADEGSRREANHLPPRVRRPTTLKRRRCSFTRIRCATAGRGAITANDKDGMDALAAGLN